LTDHPRPFSIPQYLIWYSTDKGNAGETIEALEAEVVMILLFGLCSGLAAFALLGGAAWAYFSQQRKMQSRVATTGTVVELTRQNTTRGYILCPVVEFTIPSGEKIKFTSEFGSRPASHTVGQSVAVRYDPADPQKAEVESTMSLWLVPLIMGFMGLIACCLTVVFLVFYGLNLSSFSP
jgi:hypothetical protein